MIFQSMANSDHSGFGSRSFYQTYRTYNMTTRPFCLIQTIADSDLDNNIIIVSYLKLGDYIISMGDLDHTGSYLTVPFYSYG